MKSTSTAPAEVPEKSARFSQVFDPSAPEIAARREALIARLNSGVSKKSEEALNELARIYSVDSPDAE